MKQKHFSLFLIVATSFLVLSTSSACRQQERVTSIVRVDQEHYVWREDAKPYLVYRIPAGDEFVLDTTGYEFNTSQYMYNYDSERGAYSDIDLSPNTIEILIGEIVIGGQEDTAASEDATKEPNIYRAEWHSNSQQHHINAQTLIPVGGSPPFSRFEPGQEAIITIGRLEKNESTHEELFYPFWSGMIDIQE